MNTVVLTIVLSFCLGTGIGHFAGMTGPEACLFGVSIMTVSIGIYRREIRFFGLVLGQVPMMLCLLFAEHNGALLRFPMQIHLLTGIAVGITMIGVGVMARVTND